MNAAGLTELRRALLEYVMDDAEPTWIIVKELEEARGDRRTAEAALEDLQGRGLLRRQREIAGTHEGSRADYDDWWSRTAAGWGLLGATPPRNYGYGG